MGEATAVSRAARADARRHGRRRRAVGTRDRIIAHLALVAEIADGTGMASTRLAEAVGYPGSSVAFAQLLSGMERDGLISREVRGKRTYRIALSAPAAAGRGAEPPLRAEEGGLPAFSGGRRLRRARRPGDHPAAAAARGAEPGRARDARAAARPRGQGLAQDR